MVDPFEMGDFGMAASPQDIENAIGLLDKRILEMKVGTYLQNLWDGYYINIIFVNTFCLLRFRMGSVVESALATKIFHWRASIRWRTETSVIISMCIK